MVTSQTSGHSPLGPGTAPLVTLNVWGVPTRAVPQALSHMASHPRRIRRLPGVRFTKLLGTSRPQTFTLRDADLHHWAALTVWASAGLADEGATSEPLRAWDRISHERLAVRLAPLSSRGRWSKVAPFAGSAADVNTASRSAHHPVAAITRARLRMRRAPDFWRSVPLAVADLHRAPGLLLGLGIGESPIAHMGTFSIWQDAAALTDYAYRTVGHRSVIRRTAQRGWYAEELFARFVVLRVAGSLHGEPVPMPRTPPLT